jgi:hypothetical protein
MSSCLHVTCTLNTQLSLLVRTAIRQPAGHIQLGSNDCEINKYLLNTLFVGPKDRAVCRWPAENSGSNPAGGLDVSRECCVLSGRCLCDELVSRPGESYRLWCVVVCDLETS